MRKSSSVLGCPLDSVEMLGERRTSALLTFSFRLLIQPLDNSRHPLHETVGVLSSSFPSTSTVRLKCILSMQKCIKHSPITGSLHFTKTLTVLFAALLAVVMCKFPQGWTIKLFLLLLQKVTPRSFECCCKRPINVISVTSPVIKHNPEPRKICYEVLSKS